MAHPALRQTKKWIQSFVIDHDICPFASFPFEQDQIAYYLNETATEEMALMQCLKISRHLIQVPSQHIETAFLIFPAGFEDWEAFLEFWYMCLELSESLSLNETLQIVAFHPLFQYEGLEPDDWTNYTNRSPYPMLHFLRENSVSKAVDRFSNMDQISDRNSIFLNSTAFQAYLKSQG